jgi:galactonate dehydratase
MTTIAHIESFLFNPGATRSLLFWRIETDDGLHGWGEAYVTAEKEKAVDEYLRGMAPHLIGRSPFNIRHTAQVMFDDFVIRRSSLGFLSAWSAVEMAMWDIVGKFAGLPVYNLLGGASRERVRVYANGWGDEPGTMDDRAGAGLYGAEIRSDAGSLAQFHSPRRRSICHDLRSQDA